MNTRTGWALVAALSLITSLAAVAASSPVVISEVAWAGTAASPNDEWIELYNRSQGPVDLAGWTLAFGDVVIHLGKVEGGHGRGEDDRHPSRWVPSARAIG
jgi:hypothetical protein